MSEALLTTSIPSGNLVSRGKVRDIYSTDEALILVATDRISAFDSVLSPGIAGRGRRPLWFHGPGIRCDDRALLLPGALL